MLAGTLQTWIKRRIAVRQRLGRMCTSYLLFLMEGMDFFGKCYPLMSYSVGSQERSAKMSIDTYIQQRNESNRKARAFLREVLAGGPQTYQIVHEQAVKQGISKSYLLTARRSLHVESYKSDGYAVWSLPAAA